MGERVSKRTGAAQMLRSGPTAWSRPWTLPCSRVGRFPQHFLASSACSLSDALVLYGFLGASRRLRRLQHLPWPSIGAVFMQHSLTRDAWAPCEAWLVAFSLIRRASRGALVPAPMGNLGGSFFHRPAHEPPSK